MPEGQSSEPILVPTRGCVRCCGLLLLINLNKAQKFPFAFDREFKVPSVSAATTSLVDADLLHSRLGHCGQHRLRLCPSRSTNFPRHSSLKHDQSDCDACQAGAMRRRPFPRRVKQQFTMFGQTCLTAMFAALVAVACLAGDRRSWLAPRHALNVIRAAAPKPTSCSCPHLC